MKSSQDNLNLLVILKQLYSRVMKRHAEASARSGLKKSKTGDSHDLISPLSVYISKLASNATNKPLDKSVSKTPKSENHSHDRTSINREFSTGDELGELSVHLKDSHRHSGVSLDTGDKLIQSTWEHLHTSIRLARQGNVDAAKLHAELANNALNEAAHYLSEPVYSRFAQDVMNALEEIKGQT